MEPQNTTNFWKIIPYVADILSIISFFISAINFWLIKNIKAQLLQRVSVKRYREEIQEKVKRLANYLNDYEKKKNEIKEIINVINAKLKHIKKIKNKGLLEHVKNLEKLINEYKITGFSEDKAREIKTNLSIIVDELDEQTLSYQLGGE